MKVKVVGVEFGVSISTAPSSWVKATARMDVELDNPNDSTDEAFEKAWNRVTMLHSRHVASFVWSLHLQVRTLLKIVRVCAGDSNRSRHIDTIFPNS